jgi:hypothetical protein
VRGATSTVSSERCRAACSYPVPGSVQLSMVGDSTLRNVFYEMITFAQGRSDQSWASNFDYTQQLSDGVGGLQDVRYFETYGYDGPIYPARFATWLLTDR